MRSAYRCASSASPITEAAHAPHHEAEKTTKRLTFAPDPNATGFAGARFASSVGTGRQASLRDAGRVPLDASLVGVFGASEAAESRHASPRRALQAKRPMTISAERVLGIIAGGVRAGYAEPPLELLVAPPRKTLGCRATKTGAVAL